MKVGDIVYVKVPHRVVAIGTGDGTDAEKANPYLALTQVHAHQFSNLRLSDVEVPEATKTKAPVVETPTAAVPTPIHQ